MNNFFSRKFVILLSFVIPLGVMTGCMIAYEVGPFGNYSFVIIDGLHQYMPFYSVLYDKLKRGGSLFYTFRAGLGMNFLSLMSYYLSSPLNLIILFFKKSQLNSAVSILIALKISLSGLFAGIYFSSRADRQGPVVVAASVAYALNSYMIGYCWNVMWLDAIMVLPLVIYGIDKLVEEKKGWLYCLSLFYALFCNYYIGYMICIFSVLWFFIGHFKSVRHFFGSGLHFAFSSLLAGGMAAVMLIPAYLGIRQTTSGMSVTMPAAGSIAKFIDIVNRQLEPNRPISNDNYDGNINLYLGIFILLIVVLYMLNKEIRLADKCTRILLMVLFYLSFCERLLNFIWHGFHDQFGIPNRFSFLFGFLLLTMFVDLWNHIDAVKSWHLALGSMACIGLIFYTYLKSSNVLDVAIYGIDGMLILAYAFLLFLGILSRKKKDYYRLAFCAVAVVEMAVTTVIGFSSVGQISVPKFFSGTEDMEKAVNALDDKTFYRSELADTLMVDEATWYRINTVGIFGSTAHDSMVTLMDNLGFSTGCNEYLYKGATPVTDLLFGVRYLFYHEADILDTEFAYKDKFGQFEVYENQAPDLSIGHMTDMSIDRWEWEGDYPFRVLNSLCEKGFGVTDIFRPFAIHTPKTDGCSVRRTNDGEYYFEYEKESDRHMVFTIPIRRNIKSFFIHYDGTQVDFTDIAIDGQTIVSGDIDGYIIPIGDIREGSTITLTMSLKGEDMTGYVRLSAADMDWDAYRLLMRKAKEGSYQINEFTDSSLSGIVTAGKGQMLMLSIPYDKGWRVTVDDRKTSPRRIGDAMMGIPLDEGTHYVSLSYFPPGLKAGIVISLLSWVCFGLSLAAEKMIARKMEAGRHQIRESIPTDNSGDLETDS